MRSPLFVFHQGQFSGPPKRYEGRPSLFCQISALFRVYSHGEGLSLFTDNNPRTDNMENQAEFTFACPHCGQHLAAEPDMIGVELECPSCGKAIRVPGLSVEESLVEGGGVASAPTASTGEDVGRKEVADENPFMHDWEKAKEAARVGGEAAKEYSKKAWEASKERAKVGGEVAKEYSKKAWESSKEYSAKFVKSQRFKNVCASVKISVFFCLASVWFVLRGIGIGISRITAFVFSKAFKKPPRQLTPIATRASWIWKKTILPIDLRWRKYEGRRSKCVEGVSGFAAMGMGRRIACGLTGCALLALVAFQLINLDNHDDVQYFGDSSHNSSESASTSGGFSKQGSVEIKTRRLKSGAEKVLLSDYLYDVDDVAAVGNMATTSARRSESWHRLLDRAIQLPTGKWLYHPMPDGRVFQVALVSRTTEPADLLGIRFGGVAGDGKSGSTKGWEYRYTIRDFSSNSSIIAADRPFMWEGAPWAWQTGEMNKKFVSENAPYLEGGLNMLLPNSHEMESAIENLHPGTFVESKGWILGLRLTKPDGTPFSSFQYVAFPSLQVAAQIAGLGITDDIPVFKTFAPRDKRDIVLRQMSIHGHCLIGLADLLGDVRQILPAVALGKQFKDLLELALPLSMEEFKALENAAGENDTENFSKELDRIIACLKEIENRTASAKRDSDFKRYALDEDKAQKYEIACRRSELNSLWPSQCAIFYDIWDAAYSSREYKNFIRCAWQAFPDDVSFFVKDVKDGNPHFNTIVLEMLKYGDIYLQTPVQMITQSSYGDNYLKNLRARNQGAPKEGLNGEGRWVGDSRQNVLFSRYYSERFGGGGGCEFSLRTSKAEKEFLNLEIGDVIKSDGWIREILIENSVATRQDGKQGETRKIHFRNSSEAGNGSRMLYSSARTRLEIEESIRKSHENN